MDPSSMSEEDVKRLMEGLEEERRGRKEERLGREKAERAAAEERLRREKAERAAAEERLRREKVEQKTTIPELLYLYQQLSETLKLETNDSVLTAGETSKPAGRKYPKHIVPWDNFVTRQQEIWKIIRASSTYSKRLFDPSAAMQGKKLVPVRSEKDVVANEQVIVLQPVEAVLKQLFKDKKLRQQLRIPGHVRFVNSLNLDPGTQDASTLPKEDHLPLSSNPITPIPSSKRKDNPRDTGGQADKFCIFKLENGQEKLVYNIEYKPHFKFLAAHICQGLQGEIFPDHDLINKEDEAPEYWTRRLVSVVITQLFSYLIKTGVRYGYVSTGRMMIFLHISDNAEQVKYHVWDSRDFDIKNSAFLHNTAIAEVIAFSLQALAAEPPDQAWHDAAAKLTLWPDEYVDVLKDIPETAEKERVKETPGYIASQSSNWVERSRIVLRPKHGAKKIAIKEENEEDETDFWNPRNSGCRPQDLEIKDEFGDSSYWQSEGSPLGPSRVKKSNMGRAGKKGNGNGDEAVGKHTENSRKRKRVHERDSRSANRSYRSSSASRPRHGAKHIASKEENEEGDETESLNHQTRNSGCRPQDLEIKDETGDSSDGQTEESPLGPSRVTRSNMGRAGKKGNGNGDKAVGKHTENSRKRKRVHERDYCSLPCLLGLAHGGYLDPNCPNIADHGKRHLKRLDFLRLVREQLARDRGHITDCEPLWIGGSRGAMFKVTLTSHGYTVIAKGVQRHNVPHLLHESKVYRHLRPIQGIHIPVCLGSTNLVLPYYHNGGQFVCFLFQSYAGVPVSQAINKENKPDMLSNITHAIQAIHRLRVLHCDPMPRNIMADKNSGWVQIVDFERARIQEEKKAVVRKNLPLRTRSVNGRIILLSSPSKKSMAEKQAGQNGEHMMKQIGFDFNKELCLALSSTAQCVF